MKQMLAVFNSNRINRNGSIFTVGALESGLSQSWDFGLPSLVSHDIHRPIAWSHGLCLLIEPGLVRFIGMTSIPENDMEREDVTSAFRECLSRSINEVFVLHDAELKRLLGSHLRSDEKKFVPDCAALCGPDLAVRTFPEIFRQVDKDGLVSLRKLHSIKPGIFDKDGLLIFAHPFFRRSLSRLNSLNSAFLERLQDLATKRSDLDIRIALDHDMVGLAKTLKDHIELEYWWGPIFNNDLSKIPAGVTKHAASDRLKFFYGISATEFWWYVQNNRRTFECEEIRDIPSLGVGAREYGCRFVHSIIGTDREPYHIDGAIRLYDETGINHRRGTDIMKAGKESTYRKLWRIDGSIDIEIWKELLCHYYRDNSLVGEYLGGIDENKKVSEEILNDIEGDRSASYVPPLISQGEGVRISISYHSKEACSDPRHIIALDRFKMGDKDWQPYVESDTVELIKLLRRGGKQITVPLEAVYIVFEDRVFNFPLIMHCGPEAIQNAEITKAAMAVLCEEWNKNNTFLSVVCNIGVQYSDRSVYFSMAGNPSDLCSWLRCDEAKFPRSKDDLGLWSENVAKTVNRQYHSAKDSPPLVNILEKSGLLVFKRHSLDRDQYSLKWDNEKNAMMAELKVSEKEIQELINRNKLWMAPVFLIKESKCSFCKDFYRNCLCSKTLDENVTQILTDLSLLDCIWISDESSRKKR